jgi:hypothetical protein
MLPRCSTGDEIPSATELCIACPVTTRRMPFAPRRRFYSAADHSSGARPRFCSGRNLLLDAAFHSPATMACLSASLRSRVDTPGLHLRSRPKVSPSPFDSLSTVHRPDSRVGVRTQARQGWCFSDRLDRRRNVRFIASQLHYACRA